MHGWGGTHEQLARSAEGLDSVAIDLPGFGASPAPSSPWGAQEYAKAIAPILDSFDAPPVVVGYSFGGRVAVELAAAHPDQVAALVLTGVPLLRKRGKAKASKMFRLVKRLNAVGLLSDERLEAERRKRGSADYRNASGVMRDVLVRVVNESYEEALGRVSCPVDFVWGEADTAAPVAMAEEARALVGSETTFTVVPGRSHFLPAEEPAAVRAVIERRVA